VIDANRGAAEFGLIETAATEFDKIERELIY